MQFLSQFDLMLYIFVYNTMRARGRDNHVFNKFSSGAGVDLVRDALNFLRKSYQWSVMFFGYTIVP